MNKLPGIMALMLVGCTAPVDAEVAGDDVDVDVGVEGVPFAGKPLEDCDNDTCGGGNSPKFEAGGPFHELNMKVGGTPERWSGRGYRITRIERYSTKTTCTLSVKNATVKATCAGVALQGAQLADVWIYVSATIGQPDKHVMRFIASSTAPYWVKNTTAVTPWYTVVRNPTVNEIPPPGSAVNTNTGPGMTDWKEICTGPLPPHDNTQLPPNSMVVFEGDRIDPHYKRVTDDTTGEWFTMACNKNNPMKMHISGVSTVGTNQTGMTKAGVKLSFLDRSAFAKMMSAAYCGKRAYTIHGQDSDSRDIDNKLPYAFSPQTLESRWGPNGATCITDFNKNAKFGPRVMANWTPAAGDYFGTNKQALVDMINAECGYKLPECPLGPNDMLNHFLVTSNP